MQLITRVNGASELITSVNDTGDKFMTGVVDTGHKSLNTNICENVH